MGVIFVFSSIPSSALPNFDWADLLVKKGGHALGYGLLAGSFWYGLAMSKDKVRLAWVLAAGYALSDEFHQVFTPGRNATLWDVVIDSIGAALALMLLSALRRQER